MAFVIGHRLGTAMRTKLLRCILLGLAIAGGGILAGCDDDIGVGGVGASAALPTAFTSDATDTANIGVGNVHWVGNPRW